jgi:hypothetical protein
MFQEEKWKKEKASITSFFLKPSLFHGESLFQAATGLRRIIF